MSATILNTDANINAKTVMAAENAETVTGLKSFNRSPNPPFVVQAGSANVPNLDADKLDGIDSLAFAQLANANAFTDVTDSTTATTGAIKTAGGLGVAKSLSVGTSINIIGGQIVFPATQVPSAGVNTLDDYEEGTWTPTLVSTGGGTGTYGAQAGSYVKIGQFVHVAGRITLTSKAGFTAGTLSIQTLPFVAVNLSANHFFTANVQYWQNLTTAAVMLPAYINPNLSQITLNIVPAATVSVVAIAVADISNTTDLIFSGTYRASA